jgi:hypothetical protein
MNPGIISPFPTSKSMEPYVARESYCGWPNGGTTVNDWGRGHIALLCPSERVRSAVAVGRMEATRPTGSQARACDTPCYELPNKGQ